MNEKPWFVYLIRCVDDSIYTGISTDPHRRYRQHERGVGAKYTKSHPPLGPAFLIMSCPLPSRSEALQLEHEIKKAPASQKQAMLAERNLIESFGLCRCSCGRFFTGRGRGWTRGKEGGAWRCPQWPSCLESEKVGDRKKK